MATRRVALLTAVALMVATAAAPEVAYAFERTRGDEPDTFLFWRFRSLTVYTAFGTSRDLPPARVELAVARSFDAWNDAAVGCSDLVLIDGGPAAGLSTNLLGAMHDGENRIVWREDVWPEELSETVLAQTTLVYDLRTGEMLDADIDINGVHHFWTDTDEAGRAVVDVQNTVTHELGHLIGLAHSPDPEATMFSESAPGDLDKRSLAGDDIDGLCFVYPEGLATPAAPDRRGTPLSSGCAVSSGASGSHLIWVLGLMLFGARRRGRGPASD